MDQLLGALRGPQSTNPLAPQPIGGRELLLRALGSSLPPAGRFQVPNTAGGRIGGTLGRIGAGLASTLADDLAAQRRDPLTRQFNAFQQFTSGLPQQAPQGPAGPTGPPRIDPTSIRAPSGAENLAITGPSRPPTPISPGPPRMSAENQALGLLLGRSFEEIGRPSARQRAATQASQAATQRSNVGTVQIGQEITGTAQQRQRDAKFREGFIKFRKDNPKATATETAKSAGALAAKLGASNKVTDPIFNSLSLEDKINYNAESLRIQTDQEQRLSKGQGFTQGLQTGREQRLSEGQEFTQNLQTGQEQRLGQGQQFTQGLQTEQERRLGQGHQFH